MFSLTQDFTWEHFTNEIVFLIARIIRHSFMIRGMYAHKHTISIIVVVGLIPIPSDISYLKKKYVGDKIDLSLLPLEKIHENQLAPHSSRR